MAFFAGLSHGRSRCSFHLNSSLLTDSAFCELETDSMIAKDVSFLNQFRLSHTAREGIATHQRRLNNLPNIILRHKEHRQLNTSLNSQTVMESYGLDNGTDSSSIEEFEISDTESQGRSTECDILSNIMELSSSSSSSRLSDSFQDGASKTEQVTDGSISDDGLCTNTDSVLSSSTCARNESQLQQHRPLVFFLFGLFVGLSLGFLTCEYAVDAE